MQYVYFYWLLFFTKHDNFGLDFSLEVCCYYIDIELYLYFKAVRGIFQKNVVVPFNPEDAIHNQELEYQVWNYYDADFFFIFFKVVSEDIDTGLELFMNTIIVNLFFTLIISIVQRFIDLKAIMNLLLLVLKAVTPIIWISKSSKLMKVFKSLYQR